MKKYTFKIVDTTVDFPDYYQGHSFCYSDCIDGAVGMGCSEVEAFQDALDQLAERNFDIDPAQEAEIKKGLDSSDIPFDEEAEGDSDDFMTDGPYCYMAVEVYDVD